MAFKIVNKNLEARGGKPSPKSYSFFCVPCQEWFDGLSYHSDAMARVLPLRHRCGVACEQRMKPGTRMAIRGGESNAIPREMGKYWQKYWNLNDNEMKHVTRESIDKEMTSRGLMFVDASWDENQHGSKRAAGNSLTLPPDTEDPNEVREWNAKTYGHESVVETEQEIRSMFNDALAAEQAGVGYNVLPEATTTAVHSTPHKINIEKTVQALAAAPVVSADRRKELQGRLITGK